MSNPRMRLMVALVLVVWVPLVWAEPPATAPAGPGERWIVLTAPALRAAIEPLCEARRNEGYEVVVLETGEAASPDALRAGRTDDLVARIRSVCTSGKKRSCLLLVGSYVLGDRDDGWKSYVPPLLGSIQRTEGEPTDNGYGLPGDDDVPTIAVGRFPASTPDEVRGMVDKTLAAERKPPLGMWKRRFTLLAGAPSYNPVVDAMVEKLAMSYVANLPSTWSARAVYHNPASVFCPPDDLLMTRAPEFLNEGQGLILYVGHSSPDGFWGRFQRRDWAALRMGCRGGIFVTTGCNGCDIAGRAWEGYGITAMRNPEGPAAVIGSHGITDAAMSMLVVQSALRNLPGIRESKRLGDYWLRIKRDLATETINPAVYYALDHVDGDPAIPLDVKRREHLERYVLLGDPALRFPAMPARVEMKIEGRLAAGEVIKVTARLTPELRGATGVLQLQRSLVSDAPGLETVPKVASPEARSRIMAANFARSNQFVVAELPVRADGEGLAAEIRVPTPSSWPTLIVRLYLATDTTEGMAVSRVPAELK